MYDIHTHLYWKSYDTDRDAVVERARASGVEKMLIIGCTVEESREAVALAEQYEDLYASVGIHPQEFNQQPTTNNLQREIEKLRKLAENKKVVAIGECGLEYYVHQSTIINQQPTTITEEQKAAQKAGFLAQIELVKELGLPLIVHCRASTETPDDAYRDMLEILKPITSNLKAIILHCYVGDTEVTKEFLKLLNVYFSFTGNITYPVKKSVVGAKDDLTETVKLVPLDRLFVETDCPFLSPQSKRGERNEPAYVTEVMARVAELHRKSILEVEEQIESNCKQVFKL